VVKNYKTIESEGRVNEDTFDQVENGVAVRMAMLYLVAGGEKLQNN
jgi:aspartate carbamoyltransferase catalytic subunit